MRSASEEVLSHCEVFAGLPADAVTAVAARGVTRRLERRQAHFHHGAPADAPAVPVGDPLLAESFKRH